MTIEGLYTNHPEHGGSIERIVRNLAKEAYNINIATAFFTEADLLKEFLAGGATIRLVFRLGYPTHPKAIFKLLYNKRIKLRYLTDRYFHPKLYLFDNEIALVGSANLTNSAFHVNQEIMVAIDSNDERFAELDSLYNAYWNSAKVLSPIVAKKYDELWSNNDKATWGVNKLETDVTDAFGKVSVNVIKRPGTKRSKSEELYENFKRDYQEVINDFEEIRRVYESIGIRKVSESLIPLRLEIDSFISYVRVKHAKLDSWSTAPLLKSTDREAKIRDYIAKWHKTSWPYFEKKIVHELYPFLRKVFSSPGSIESANDKDLLDAIAVLHAFITQQRFTKGGLEFLKESFLTVNGRKRINFTLSYLLFGSGEIERRMCECIYGPEYRLAVFSHSNVQEIVGWLNSQELPVINLRTRKVIRFFGFDVWGD